MDVAFVTVDGKLSAGKEFSLISIDLPQADMYLVCNPRGWELWGSLGYSETLSKLREQTQCLQLRTENTPYKA